MASVLPKYGRDQKDIAFVISEYCIAAIPVSCGSPCCMTLWSETVPDEMLEKVICDTPIIHTSPVSSLGGPKALGTLSERMFQPEDPKAQGGGHCSM